MRSCTGVLSLALALVVLKMFLPEVAVGLIQLIVKVIAVLNGAVDQAALNLPN